MGDLIPRCEEAKAILQRIATGEGQGELAYVVPLIGDDERAKPPWSGAEVEGHAERRFQSQLAGLTLRQWGHDHSVPKLKPGLFGQSPIADAYGAPYSYAPTGTTRIIHRADEIASLPLNLSLHDGRFNEALEAVRYFAREAKGKALVTQYHYVLGPLNEASLVIDIAALCEGLYTHPKAVHRILEQNTELFINFLKAQKELVPDLVFDNYHDDTFWPEDAGVLQSEDILVTMSPKMAMEFVVPYANQIAQAFGGVLIHACGNWAHHFEILRDHVKGLRGIHFNAGECSLAKAVEVFSGTPVVLFVRWLLNTEYRFASRLDFVRHALATKTPDVSMVLDCSSDPAQSSDPYVAKETDPNVQSMEILRVIARYQDTGIIE
ncbi:MAG: uroporphyrinogen decarboxylase family protein [Anaerolineae bacterium]